jgi:serine protease Do
MRQSKRSLTLILALALLSLGYMTFSPGGPAAAQPAMAPETFADLAARVSPAVVNISTEKTIKGRNRVWEFFGPPTGPRSPRGRGPEDPFREFFEKFFEDMPKTYKGRSLGSGVIIDSQGYIITNNHVIEGADKITVRLVGGKEFTGEVKGRDPKTDLALIKINNPPKDLPSIPLGDSDAIRVGDWVLAVGNPFGLSHTVTHGIISAKGRVIGSGPYDNFLQTDASINPGNSGGPLINLKGEVVGINTAILAAGQGIGFATPSNVAKSVIPQLREKGKVVRGMLGVQVQVITQDLAKSLNLSEPQGALVSEVNPDTPAAKAGIHRGDIIISFNDQPIKDMHDLPRLVAVTPPGTATSVKVLRDGKEHTFKITVAELKDEKPARTQKGRESEEENPLGLTVDELDASTAQRYRLGQAKGVVVVNVDPSSPAADAGFAPGDVILEINGQLIKKLEEYEKAISSLKKGSYALFLVSRQGRTQYLSLRIP